MLSKIRDWFIRYNFEITWFLTGWFSAYLVVDLSAGNLFGALIDLVIVVVNLSFGRR